MGDPFDVKWILSLEVLQLCRSDLIGWFDAPASADEFLDAALTWFGDPDPRTGTAWENGERLAKLIAHRRTCVPPDQISLVYGSYGGLEPAPAHTLFRKALCI
jgi:hypothetical protein